MTAGATVLVAPLRIEAHALRRGAPEAPLVRAGMGPARAAAVALPADGAVLVAGFGGALTDDLAPGDIVVASEVSGPGGQRAQCTGTEELCESLAGLPVRVGPIASVRRPVRGRHRRQLAATALIVDMESFWIASAAGGRPFAVVRVVVDTPRRELLNPFATVAGGLRAYRTLTRSASLLAAWRPRYFRSSHYVNEEPCPSPLGKARA